MPGGASFAAAVFVVTCLFLYVILIGGYLGLLFSQWVELRERPRNSQLCFFCQKLGIAIGTFGVIFRVPSLTFIGILLLALSLVLSPHDIMPLRGPVSLFVYLAGGICLVLVALARL